MAVFPAWFGPLTGGPEPAADAFEAVERRVRGGMVLGVGLIFIARTELRPWSLTIASVIFYFVLGALVARIYGIIIEGATPKQWMLSAVEAVIMAVAAGWMWRVTPGA